MNKHEIKLVHRLGKPLEINLKQFYQLSIEQKKEHIEELKKINFKDLSETDKGVIFLYYQNWNLENWPIPKKNFIEL